ncbi:MAG: ABC transporter substrate-binding protein [Candidatus Acidiferrales bacterium]
MIALLCGACLYAAASVHGKVEARQLAKPEAKPEVKRMTREVIDETGRHVAVPVDVRRIVTLAPNLTEIVYALGAQDRLVGVSNYSDYPAAAKAKPRVGMQLNPNLEAIVAARPDIVLVAAVNRYETVDALARLGIAVYGTDPRTVEGTLESIEHIGGVIGASAQAESVVVNLRQRLDALKSKLAGVPPARVLFVVWRDPLTSLGAHTFIADALRFADAQSVVEAKQDWPQISLEEVVRLNPDYLVFASSHFGDAGSRAQRLAELRSEAGWRELNAVREGHVAVISDEINLPAPGLVDAIAQLARQLHPSAFAQTPQPRASARQSPAFVPAFAQLRGRPLPKFCMEANACAR